MPHSHCHAWCDFYADVTFALQVGFCSCGQGGLASVCQTRAMGTQDTSRICSHCVLSMNSCNSKESNNSNSFSSSPPTAGWLLNLLYHQYAYQKGLHHSVTVRKKEMKFVVPMNMKNKGSFCAHILPFVSIHPVCE